MTRIVMAGFETGSTLTYGSDSVGSQVGTTAVVSTVPSARSGTFCWKGTVGTTAWNPLNSGQQWSIALARKTWAHASKTELWYAFGLFAHHSSEVAAPGNAVMALRDTASNVNVTLHLDSGILRAYYASAGGASPDVASQLVLIAAASTSMSMDAWHLVEVHVIAATGSTGTCEVWLDGTSIVSATSQRTAQLNANLGSLEVGMIPNRAYGAGATLYHAFDDVRVNDTLGTINNGRPGDGKILGLLPNGVGATIGGTPLTGVPGSPNWQNVDEVPASITDYNYGSTVGTGELYTMTDPPGVITSCAAVNLIAYALNSDAGGGSIGLTVNTGGSNSEATATPITATATYYNRLMETDPSDSTAWTQTKLTNLSTGIIVR